MAALAPAGRGCGAPTGDNRGLFWVEVESK
jgi:hypothetical protein